MVSYFIMAVVMSLIIWMFDEILCNAIMTPFLLVTPDTYARCNSCNGTTGGLVFTPSSVITFLDVLSASSTKLTVIPLIPRYNRLNHFILASFLLSQWILLLTSLFPMAMIPFWSWSTTGL